MQVHIFGEKWIIVQGLKTLPGRSGSGSLDRIAPAVSKMTYDSFWTGESWRWNDTANAAMKFDSKDDAEMYLNVNEELMGNTPG